jgi:hypothetical protein
VQRPMLCLTREGAESTKHPVAIKQTPIAYADQIAKLAIDQHREPES